MAAWPATLPKPTAAGFSIKPKSPVIATDFEAGNRRTRRRTMVKRDNINVSFVLDHDQVEIFREWYDSDTGGDAGNAWFDITLNTGYGGSLPVEAKLELSEVAPISGKVLWQVTGTMEIRYA